MNQEATSAPESSTSVINLKTPVKQEDGEEEEDRPEFTKDGPEPVNAVDIVGPPPEFVPGAVSPADTSSSEEPPLALVKSVPLRVNGSSKPKSGPELPSPVPQTTYTPVGSPPPPPAPQQQQQPSPRSASTTVPLSAPSAASARSGSVRSVSKVSACPPTHNATLTHAPDSSTTAGLAEERA